MPRRPFSFFLIIGVFLGCANPGSAPRLSPKTTEFNFVYTTVKSVPSQAHLNDIKIETEIESCIRVNSFGTVDSIEYVRGMKESEKGISAFFSKFTFAPATLNGGAQPSRLIIKLRSGSTPGEFEYKIIHIGSNAPILSWAKLP